MKDNGPTARERAKAIGMAVAKRFIQWPIQPGAKSIGKAVKIPVIKKAIIKAMKN